MADPSHAEADFVEQRLQELLDRLIAYRPDADLDLVRRAFAFAKDVHDGQLRQSGEPYIIHPLEAAHIMADIEADEESLAACLMHDTVEDCAQDEEREIKTLRLRLDELKADGKLGQAQQLASEIRAQEAIVEKLKDEVHRELRESFGEVISGLVDGVTRLSEVRFAEQLGMAGADAVSPPDELTGEPTGDSVEARQRRLQSENLRRMVVAAARDHRVLLIKLADRLHNLRTLYAKRRPKQIKIARESEVIYAKLAGRLGVWRIKWEMEDLALRYLHPEAYQDLERRVAKTRDERMAEIEGVVNTLHAALEENGIRHEVYGRPKHLYSIYHKMRRQGIDFDQVHDLEAVRVVVESDQDCYLALCVIHGLWRHQPEHFTDYISNPKPNGYQSIHTKVVVPAHGPMEIQVRTQAMHRAAEYGVAAHWRYKSSGTVDERFARHLNAMRRLFEAAQELEPGQATNGDSDDEADDFMVEVEDSLAEQDIFVFTPKGDTIELPLGATVIDFAYRIHTQVGHTCVGARVNNRNVPLTHQLRGGEVVEIKRQPNTGPSRDWLKHVRTRAARQRIRQYFRLQERDTLVAQGNKALEAAAKTQRLDLKELYRRDHLLPDTHRRRSTKDPVEDLLTRVARLRGYQTDEDLLSAVGEGVVSAEGIVNQLVAVLNEATEAAGLTRVDDEPVLPERPSQAERGQQPSVSVDGQTNLMMRRSQCCLPLPGDDILGYVTRTAGIAIHRADCANLRHLREREADRVITLDWTQTETALYDIPIELRCHDRVGLLRDVTGLMSELDINILAANTTSPHLNSASHDHLALVRLKLELVDRRQLNALIDRLPNIGVIKASINGQVFLDIEKGHRKRGRSSVRRADGSSPQPGKPGRARASRKPSGSRGR